MTLPQSLLLRERAIEFLISPGEDGTVDRGVIDRQIRPFGLRNEDTVGTGVHVESRVPATGALLELVDTGIRGTTTTAEAAR